MRNMTIAAAALLTLAALCGAPRSAAAAYNLPWCAQYYDRSEARSCAFFTFEQCRASVSGIGGTCFANPFLPPAPPEAAARRPRPRRYAAPR